MLVFDIFDLPRVKRLSPFKKLELAARVGTMFGTTAGAIYATQIQEKGAASGPVFSQEMFDYEISAIRMGAQI